MTQPRNLDTGACRIERHRKLGRRVHACRPPIGNGLVCDPVISIGHLVVVEEPIDCKVCLSRMNNPRG